MTTVESMKYTTEMICNKVQQVSGVYKLAGVALSELALYSC
jgi:hypothetical protein